MKRNTSKLVLLKQTSSEIQQKTEEVDGATTEECDGARLNNRGPLRLSFRTRRRQVITTPSILF